MKPTYELSQPPVCSCGYQRVCRPYSKCKVCLDIQAQRDEAEQRQREASLRDLQSAHRIGRQHGASLSTYRAPVTDEQKREAAIAFVLAVAVIAAFLSVWWLVWDINEKAHLVGTAIRTHGEGG